MQRREFIKLCTLTAAVGAPPVLAAADMKPRFYNRVQLVDGQRRPLKAASLATGVASARIPPASMEPLIGPGYRPTDRDEVGIWQLMDRVEEEVAGSNLVMKDEAASAYLRDLIGQLAEHFVQRLVLRPINVRNRAVLDRRRFGVRRCDDVVLRLFGIAAGFRKNGFHLFLHRVQLRLVLPNHLGRINPGLFRIADRASNPLLARRQRG